MFMPPGCRVRYVNIRRASARRLSMVLRKPARITDTIVSSVVCPGEQKCLATGMSAFFLTERQMFTEPVLEPASGFATTSNKVNDITPPARKSLSDRQRATRGVDLGRCVCVGAGLTPWAVTGKGSSQVIPSMSFKLVSRRNARGKRKSLKTSLVSGSD